jgi:hypothetical protein
MRLALASAPRMKLGAQNISVLGPSDQGKCESAPVFSAEFSGGCTRTQQDRSGAINSANTHVWLCIIPAAGA